MKISNRLESHLLLQVPPLGYLSSQKNEREKCALSLVPAMLVQPPSMGFVIE